MSAHRDREKTIGDSGVEVGDGKDITTLKNSVYLTEELIYIIMRVPNRKKRNLYLLKNICFNQEVVEGHHVPSVLMKEAYEVELVELVIDEIFIQ